MKTIVAGSRTITDVALVERSIAECGWEVTEVVSGECRGPDLIGRDWAERNGVPVRPFPADWTTYGRSAGPRRNREMAAYADALILVWDGRSDGSASMLNFALARRLIVEEVYVRPDGSWIKRRHPRGGNLLEAAAT